MRARLRRATDRFRLQSQLAALSERVDLLEAQLAQERRLQRRVAELTDVVQQLLLPQPGRDESELQQRLDRYADEL